MDNERLKQQTIQVRSCAGGISLVVINPPYGYGGPQAIIVHPDAVEDLTAAMLEARDDHLGFRKQLADIMAR